MDLTRYNPNNDRGITQQMQLSGIRCLDGEDLRKCIFPLMGVLSEGQES